MVTADQRVLAQTSVEDQPASVDGDARYDLCAGVRIRLLRASSAPGTVRSRQLPSLHRSGIGRSPAWSAC